MYKKSAIKVLLGPESLLDQGESGDGAGTAATKFPVRGHGLRKQTDNQVFEKIGETNVYKRIRPFQALKSRPRLVRCPSTLQLEGQKVDTEDTKLNLTTVRTLESARSLRGAEDSFTSVDDMDRKSTYNGENPLSTNRDLQSAGSYSPTLKRTGRDRVHQNGANTISQNFLTEFGLRTERTDTFSGHQRRRGASADMERQLELSAERHIRTCQVVGNLKRSSRAQQSCQGLKDTVSPLHSPFSNYPTERLRRYNSTSNLKERPFYKSDQSLDQLDNHVPYLIQIRRNIGSICKMKPLGKPFTRSAAVPEVNSRTLIVGTSVQFS